VIASAGIVPLLAVGSSRIKPRLWLRLRRIAGGRSAIRPGQARVDLLRTQIVECWIEQCVGGKLQAIGNEDWVDRQICGTVPQFRLPLPAPTLVRQCAVENIVGKNSL